MADMKRPGGGAADRASGSSCDAERRSPSRNNQPDQNRQPRSLRRVLEEACAQHDVSLKDLTVLSAQVDPYRMDTPAGHRDGEWLKEQLDRLYGPTRRAHWRGLHYAIVA